MGTQSTHKSGVRVCIALLAGLCATHVFALVPEVSYQPNPQNDPGAEPSPVATDGSLQHAPDMLDRVVNYQHDTLAGQRTRFLEAEKALKKRQLTRFRKMLSTLVDYPLYPYLKYQDIQRRLGKTGTKELNQFLANYEGQPIARKLRYSLLRHSAQKGQWQRFLAFYTPQNSARLRCDHAYALIRTGKAESAYPEIEELWLSGKSQPRNCDRVFKHWKAAGKQMPELVWKRFELALNKGNRSLATYLVRSLPPGDRRLARTWIKLHRQPARLPQYQARLLDSSHDKSPVILNSVVKRLAGNDPQQAADILKQTDLLNQLPETNRHEIAQALALSLALKHLSGAEHWFSQVPNQYLSNSAREWRIRVALRESQWQTALNAMNGLSVKQQESDRWRYWRARALEEQGLETTALAQFSTLAKRRSYFGFLAADRMGLPYAMKDNPHEPSAAEIFTIVQRPDVRRTRELLQLDRITEARREWYSATRTMNDAERADASKLAQHWGWVGQSILTMARTSKRDDLDLRFPLQFQDKVMTHSRQASIDPAWTYGVIRRESAFIRDARSSKGAVGLMQLMPATAKRMSRSIKKVRYRGSSQLTHADTNLALGTHYLNKMLERFGGQTVLATAAYNAGENRVDRWLPSENDMDAERWIENIPYKETREYVANVLAFTVIYADRMGMKGQRLSERMEAVTPKESILVKRAEYREQLAALKNDNTHIR